MSEEPKNKDSFVSGIDPYAVEPKEPITVNPQEVNQWYEDYINANSLRSQATKEPISRQYCLDLAAKAKYGTVAELLQEADKIYNYLKV